LFLGGPVGIAPATRPQGTTRYQIRTLPDVPQICDSGGGRVEWGRIGEGVRGDPGALGGVAGKLIYFHTGEDES